MKDLSLIGRNLEKVIIIDNISENFMAQPDNGIHIKSWYSDPQDRELTNLVPFLKDLVERKVPDVRDELKKQRAEWRNQGSPIASKT